MVTVQQKLSKEVLELLEKDKTKKLTDLIEQDIIDDLVLKYDQHILEKARIKLESLGFEFESEQDFISLCVERVNKLYYENKENYFELYLDFKGENNKGELILFGNENINIQDVSNGKVTYTIG